VTGVTNSADFPLLNPADATQVGLEAFVAKLAPSPPPPPPAPKSSETKVACAIQAVAIYACAAVVGDADPGVDADPTGTVAFFLDAISTSGFLGQCTLGSLLGPGGLSGCVSGDLAVPSGPHTIWAVYYPAGGSPYAGSVGNDDVGNPAVATPDPTDTKVLCVPTAAAGTTQPLDCQALVADDDGDAGPGSPTGTVAVFRDAIATDAFVGQCTLSPVAPAGLSACPPLATSPVPAGESTMWDVFYPTDANYQTSVDNDPVTV
jgi:hypothetical protein